MGVRDCPLRVASAVLAASAVVLLANGDQHHAIGLQASSPLGFSLMAPSPSAVARPARASDADATTTRAACSAVYRSSSVGAGRLAGAVAALAAMVACGRVATARTRRHAKVRGTWKEKQKRNQDYLARHPPPLMKKRALTFKIMYAKLARRDDHKFCEWAAYFDPRDPEYQWSVEKVRKLMENPEYKSMEVQREALGIPLPPIRLTEAALKQLRSGQGGGGGEASDGNLPDRGQQKPKGPVDLSSVEYDFIKFKGYEVSKKVLARLQATASKKK